MTTKTYRARYIFPVSQPPIAGGYVTVASGRVVAVGPTTTESDVEDLGGVALLPGLVNAHTHLEFSDLAEPLGQRGNTLPDWIRSVVAQRRGAASDNDDGESRVRCSIEAGLRESAEAGVVALGEIATTPWQPSAFPSTDIRTTLFYEQIGLREERAANCLDAATSWLRNNEETDTTLRGLSPHAPYSVRPELVRQLCTLSQKSNVPVAMHLAESTEEIELLNSSSGPFVEMLKDFDAWDADAIPHGLRPLDYLEMLALATSALVVHGNYLTTEEIGFVATHRNTMSIVYCPRTFDYFHAGTYPLSEMLASGTRVALGTDSRASNPDLNIWSDVQFAAARHTDVSPAEILKVATQNGAEALGHKDLGTIEVGKRALFTIIPIDDSAPTDPHDLLLTTST